MRRSACRYAQWAGLDDPVIDVSVTPNRGDCFSVRGIARDLAAAGIGTPEAVGSRRRSPPAFRGGPRWQIDWPAACPWILGRTIRSLRNGPSPHWLQDRLTSIGLRPINALVDITNFFTYRPRPPAACVRRGEAARRRADPAHGARRDVPAR